MSSTRATRRAAAAALSFAVLLLWTYRPVFEGQVLAGRDLFRLFIPDAAFLLECLEKREWPLWLPYSRLGQPFAATLQSQAFYLPRLLSTLLLGPERGLMLEHLEHVALSGVGIFVLCRRLGRSWQASCAAAAALCLTPLMGMLGMQQNALDSAAWTGLMLAAALSIRARPGVGPIAWLAFLTAHSFLAGSPEVIVGQGVLALAIGVQAGSKTGQTTRFEWTERARRAVRVLAGLAWSGALSALVVLPALELARNSKRSAGFGSIPEQALAWSMSWHQVLGMVLPNAELPKDRYWGEDQRFLIYVFLGTVTVALALLATVRGNRRARPFAWVALLFTVMSLGRHLPPVGWVLSHVPPFSLFRFPAKYFIGATFCVPVLAAFGLDRMAALMRRRLPRFRTAGLLVAGTLAALPCIYRLLEHGPLRAGFRGGLLWAVSTLGLLAAAGLAVPGRGAIRTRRARAVLLVLVTGEMVIAAAIQPLVFWVEARKLSASGPIAARIPRSPDTRLSVYLPEGAEIPDEELVSVDESRAGLMPQRWVEERLTAVDGYGAPEPRGFGQSQLIAERPLFNLLGVAYFVRWKAPFPDATEVVPRDHDRDLPGLFHVTTAGPRAFIVQRTRVLADVETLNLLSSDASPGQSEALLPPGSPELGLAAPCEGSVAQVLEGEGLQRVSVQVHACARSLLVLTDAYYPDWFASVDGGEQVAVQRVDLALRGVTVPGGEHRVDFVYRPASFRIGSFISLLGWLALLGAAAGSWRRRRSTNGNGAAGISASSPAV